MQSAFFVFSFQGPLLSNCQKFYYSMLNYLKKKKKPLDFDFIILKIHTNHITYFLHTEEMFEGLSYQFQCILISLFQQRVLTGIPLQKVQKHLRNHINIIVLTGNADPGNTANMGRSSNNISNQIKAKTDS